VQPNHNNQFQRLEKENQTMDIIKGSGRGPATRLETGAAIVAAAGVVDTALIKARLSAFMLAHRAYAGAQDKVEAAEADLRAAQARLGRRNLEVDDAVEALALALANEGHSRLKPFAAFGAGTPSSVQHLTARDKPKAVHHLVANVQRAKTLSQKTRDAARAAEQAARNAEAAFLPIDHLEVSRRDLRRQRDTIGRRWDTALTALRRETRSAADDGAPGLYTALFGWAARAIRKNGKPAPAPEPAPPPTPASTA
jgi:hypothetical protein